METDPSPSMSGRPKPSWLALPLTLGACFSKDEAENREAEARAELADSNLCLYHRNHRTVSQTKPSKAMKKTPQSPGKPALLESKLDNLQNNKFGILCT